MKAKVFLILVYSWFLLPGILVAVEKAPAPRPVASKKAQPEVVPAVPTVPKLIGPKDNKAKYLAELHVTGVPKGTSIWWDVLIKVKTEGGVQVYVEAADVQSRIVKTEQAFIFSGPVGSYKVRCRLTKADDNTELIWEGELTGAVAPIPPTPPTPPIPPGPTPKPPEPPTPPDPNKVDNPFGAAPGLRIMVVFESMDDAKRPLGEYLILRGAKFREYLDANCVADGYRIVDQNAKSTDPTAWYAVGLKRTDRKSLPWLYIGKEASGYSGPLPKDSDETIKIIDKFLGK